MSKKPCVTCGGTRKTQTDCQDCPRLSGRREANACRCGGRGVINHTCSACGGTGVAR